MKIIPLVASFLVLISIASKAQVTFPADGNKKASVSEFIGITEVKINYSRPGVKGREGQIWGNVVHYGFKDFNYGTSKSAPWRAGANENTTIEFTADVFIEGQALEKGKYGFFIAMGEEKATVVFSKYNNAWGSFYYDEKYDALRVEVPVLKQDESVERLKYEFDDQTENSAVISMQWEKMKVPFKVSVDLQKIQIESFRHEINSGDFYVYWQNMQRAANYCLVNDINLEEGLSWAYRSIYWYFGESNFLTLSTYAGLLEKNDRAHEADSILQIAIPMATENQLFNYGNDLNRMKQHKKALEIFQKNLEKNPDGILAHLGMGFGYYYTGDVKKALKFCDSAKEKTDIEGWRNYIDGIIKKIKAGEEFIN
jgi:tetratricopeptide (TPR) repeat protein